MRAYKTSPKVRPLTILAVKSKRVDAMPLLSSERHGPDGLPISGVPWNEGPVRGQLLPGDLTKLELEHVSEALAAVDGEANGRVRDQVIVRVSVFREHEADGKAARIGIDVSVWDVFVAGIAAEAGQ